MTVSTVNLCTVADAVIWFPELVRLVTDLSCLKTSSYPVSGSFDQKNESKCSDATFGRQGCTRTDANGVVGALLYGVIAIFLAHSRATKAQKLRSARGDGRTYALCSYLFMCIGRRGFVRGALTLVTCRPAQVHEATSWSTSTPRLTVSPASS